MKAIAKTPKRVAKNMRKLLRNDVKLANTDKMLTLAEYNYFFNTNYSFEDVFGKENMEKATAEKLKYYENYWLLYIDIDHYLPDDDYKRTALTFVVNFLYNDFSEFEEVLDDDVTMVVFKQKSIRGKQAVMEYWKDYRIRIKKEIVRRFEVKFCPYYSATGLFIEIRGYAPICLLYSIEGGKIKNLVYYLPDSGRDHHHDEIINTIPYSYVEAQKHFIADTDSISNHIPCFYCGTPSEQLEWHRARFEYYNDEIFRKISVCPKCHCVVESGIERYNSKVLEWDESKSEDTSDENHKKEIVNKANGIGEIDEYARKGNEYRNELEKIARGSDKSQNALFELLPEVHLRDGHEVRFAEKDLDEIDGFYYFYVFDSELNMEKTVYHYVDVNPTPMGVWQLYLLMCSEDFIDFNIQRPGVKPYRDVFDRGDLEQLTELNKRDIKRIKQCGYLFPKVSIEKTGDDMYIGEVFSTYWRADSLWRRYDRYVIDKCGKVDWKQHERSRMLLHREPGPEIY